VQIEQQADLELSRQLDDRPRHALHRKCLGRFGRLAWVKAVEVTQLRQRAIPHLGRHDVRTRDHYQRAAVGHPVRDLLAGRPATQLVAVYATEDQHALPGLTTAVDQDRRLPRCPR
jgi:hypothetical protein